MSKKKSKKKNIRQPQQSVKLSQCMIVKNEEKNIERALGWAKSATFEQIVVDTGSTDRTVEIATKMGAKVYHFKWIRDFAAAKNYAIEQAKGDWVAFLDADEYFTPEDTEKMIDLLNQLNSEPQLRKLYLALNCPLVQLNDRGEPFGVDVQTRLFRNVPSVRYIGKIHEELSLKSEEIIKTEDFSIIHTGYAETSYMETGKAERNIEMLRKELARTPDNMELKVYLADSLRVKAGVDGSDGGAVSEAEAGSLYAEVTASDGDVRPMLKKKAHMYTVGSSIASGKPPEECERLCLRALKDFPEDIDFEYYHGKILNMKDDYKTAIEILRSCEAKLIEPDAIHKSTLVAITPSLLFVEMILAAQGTGDVESTVKYAVMALSEDKSRAELLRPLIAILVKQGTSENEIIALLEKIYNMCDPGDVLLIARTAKDCGAMDLTRRMIALGQEMTSGF